MAVNLSDAFTFQEKQHDKSDGEETGNGGPKDGAANEPQDVTAADASVTDPEPTSNSEVPDQVQGAPAIQGQTEEETGADAPTPTLPQSETPVQNQVTTAADAVPETDPEATPKQADMAVIPSLPAAIGGDKPAEASDDVTTA